MANHKNEPLFFLKFKQQDQVEKRGRELETVDGIIFKLFEEAKKQAIPSVKRAAAEKN